MGLVVGCGPCGIRPEQCSEGREVGEPLPGGLDELRGGGLAAGPAGQRLQPGGGAGPPRATLPTGQGVGPSLGGVGVTRPGGAEACGEQPEVPAKRVLEADEPTKFRVTSDPNNVRSVLQKT